MNPYHRDDNTFVPASTPSAEPQRSSDDDPMELIWKNGRLHVQPLKPEMVAGDDCRPPYTSDSVAVKRMDECENIQNFTATEQQQPPEIPAGSIPSENNFQKSKNVSTSVSSAASDSTSGEQPPDRKRKGIDYHLENDSIESTQRNKQNHASTSTKRSRTSETSDEYLTLDEAIRYGMELLLQMPPKPKDSNVVPTMVPGYQQHPMTPNNGRMSTDRLMSQQTMPYQYTNMAISRPSMPYECMNMAVNPPTMPYQHMNMALNRPSALSRPLMPYQSVWPNVGLAGRLHAPQSFQQYHTQGFEMQNRSQEESVANLYQHNFLPNSLDMQNTNRPGGSVAHPYQNYPGLQQRQPPPPPGSNTE